MTTAAMTTAVMTTAVMTTAVMTIAVMTGLRRSLRLCGLDIGFDEGPPGSIGPRLVVDHAELLPPSCGVPSQAFLGRPLESQETADN
jgi:hypothetical protein